MPRKDAQTLLNELRRDRDSLDATIKLIEAKMEPAFPRVGRTMPMETRAKISKAMKETFAARKA